MLYAVFSHPHYGRESDSRLNNRVGLVKGCRYLVERVDVGGFMSYVYLVDFPNKMFNSVCFSFEDEYGNEVDIYNNPMYY